MWGNITIKKTLFFNGVELLPWFAADFAVGSIILAVRLERTRETGRGGLARMRP